MLDAAVLKTYRNRLTNLTGRNRSLLLTTLPAEQFLDLHDADFLLNRPSFDLVAQLMSRRAAVSICDVLDARNERVNEVSKRLRRMARTAQFIEAERGTEDLYVGWPFVRGKFMDGTVVHGPLLFFPVNLIQAGNRWQLTRRGDSSGMDASAAVLNTSFALAYGHFNQVKVGEDTLEKEFSDFDKDPLAFRTQLYEWLKTTPLELNTNPDLFTDLLVPFDRQTSKNLDALERTGELKLFSEAVLGIFPQAGSFLVPDYDALIERAIVSTGTFAFSQPPPQNPRLIREEQLHTPLPLDASQEAAVRAVKAGESVVVQGPPGTGKSQLIANLMADAAADGKRVLLVCQKRAALDVVYKRLREVNMGPFVGLIHDFQNDRSTLYRQLAGQIADVEGYRTRNTSLDAVLLERSFDTESRRIDELVADLQAFKDALFDVSACGLSVKELYLSAIPGVATPGVATPNTSIDLSAVYAQFRFDQLDGFLRKLTDYATYQQRLGQAHPFAERVSFSGFGASALSAAERAVTSIAETAPLIAAQTALLVNQPLMVATLMNVHENAWTLTALLNLADGADVETRWQLARTLLVNPAHPARTIDELALTKLADAWESTLAAPGPEPSLQPADVSAFRAILASALAVRGSWFSWNWWQLTNPGRAELARVLAANALSASETDLQTLAQKVEKRSRRDELRPQTTPLLTLSPTLPDVPASLRMLRQAREMGERLSGLDALLPFRPAVWETFDGFSGAVRTMLRQAELVQQQRNSWKTYLTDAQIERVWAEPVQADILRQALRHDFDVLVETDQLTNSFSATESTVINGLSKLPPASWVRHFQTALCLHWIEHIEQQHPILRSVSSLKMEQMERALQDSVTKKQSLSRDILLVKLREQTYHDLTVNRLNNLVSYRELQHQTTKKRSIWPVRRLMSQFADEVFKLVPCWLASPESVSAMFPLTEGLFDLVIFDEASQCFAESGIPAMARGRQVVVAGDSQQLRPSDLYRIRLDADTVGESADVDQPADNSAKLETESLLELAAQTLAQVSLTSHYRSRSPELIEFSNQHFYGNKLTLLPDFNNLEISTPPAIRYHNVKGTWQQNTNPAEADAVVELIGHLATELPGMSIGVVTFNYQQQQLIQEKLETQLDFPRSGTGVSEATFVKNIENVQGDERDVIIFSVGYAADERGRLAMQFGSLNGRGGENRLNVAVTRARERVYVVTSLWPEQLNVEQSVNAGPKLLKAYLSYALGVAQGKFRPQPRPVVGIRSSALLKTRLTAQHPNWQPALPFADLTRLKDNAYQSLILTDDDLYFQQTPKDAHAYLPVALQARHWPFQRIWSREFWRKFSQ